MNTVRYDYQKLHFRTLEGGHRELTGLLCQFVETQADTSVADHPSANRLT